MSFGSPLCLLGLLLVPAVLAFLLVLRRRPSRHAVAFSNLEVLAAVVAPRAWRRWVPVVLFLVALATAATATARPKARFTTAGRHSTIVLLVDVSGSMSAEDVKPTRLDAAAIAMKNFVDRLPKNVDVGLVQFSSEPEILQWPTARHNDVHDIIGYLLPQAGTAIGDGLAAAVSLFHGPGAIVLLSDGAQTRGRLTPLEGAERARERGVRVDTIALGTPDGELVEGGYYEPVPPDPSLMRAIARATGGHTFSASDSTTLSGIYTGLGTTLAPRTTTREVTSWFAVAAGGLLLAALALASLWGAALP